MKGHTLKRLFALSLLALVVWACESPTGVQVQKPNFLQSCAGIPNGGVTKVTASPDPFNNDSNRTKIHQINTPKRDTIYAHVFRDDPNWPGEQVWCEDVGATVAWTNETPAPYVGFLMTNIHPRDVTIYNANDWASGSWRYLVATAGSKKDTVFVQTVF